jgi:hypothetical protein
VSFVAFVPFLLQGIVLGFDEFYCHRRRHLRKWERWGHPIDTAVFVLALAWLLISKPIQSSLYIYVGASVFSSLLITKDEWEHLDLCSGLENWLHALLYILHPCALIWAGVLWWTGSECFRAVVGMSAGLATSFGIYQVVAWNLLQRR